MVVTFKSEVETSDKILGRIRSAIKAADGRMEVENVRRTKDRKIIVSCKTKNDRTGVKKMMERKDSGMIVEEVQNRDPMLVLKDILKITPKEEIYQALRNQNRALFDGLDETDTRMQMKFERRARNPPRGASGSTKAVGQGTGDGHGQTRPAKSAGRGPITSCAVLYMPGLWSWEKVLQGDARKV
jgi:hypothetical protein